MRALGAPGLSTEEMPYEIEAVIEIDNISRWGSRENILAIADFSKRVKKQAPASGRCTP